MFELGSLPVYKFQFIIELLICEGMFAYKFKRRKYFIVRVILSLAAVFGLVALFVPIYNAWYVSLMFLVFFIATLGAMFVCFKTSVWNVLFCGCAAYTIQHIAYLLNVMLSNLITDSINSSYIIQGIQVELNLLPLIAFIYFICYFIVYALSFFLLVKMMPRHPDLQLGASVMIIISVLVVVADIVFNMFTAYNENADVLSVYIEYSYNLIVCVLVLSMMFEKLLRRNIELKYGTVQKVLEAEQRQYERLKENMDVINVKCHDLKHQLRDFRSREGIADEELVSIENAINIYDNIAKTGNGALDVVLTEKLLLCEKNGIDLTYLADGSVLSFMSDMDIYSLFGNALENAVEAVKTLPENERQIKLVVKDVGDIVSVRVSNNFNGELKIKDGRLATTKQDSKNHGFGVLSMEMIAEKYNGKIKTDAKDGVFILSVVLFKKSEK